MVEQRSTTDVGDVTEWLGKLGRGEPGALEELVPRLYGELRRIARENLRRERAQHTLQTTALVHEAYLRLLGSGPISVDDRARFFGAASRAMQRVLVDYARARRREKRGGGAVPVPLDEVEPFLSVRQADEILALEDALGRLESLDERAARVVRLRFFGGLTMDEIAGHFGMSERTVRRDWITARAWLRKEVAADLGVLTALEPDERSHGHA
ncbi:MAG: sigma-70 family RNA polymerase sigma factor [Acidobacteriota bacterium]